MNEDFASILTDEQSNPNGLLLEILSSGYEDWDFIVAVEGPDDQDFYFDFLSSSLSKKDIFFLKCGGKKALLRFKEAANDYDWVHPPKFLFLCDKDFDDYLNSYKDGVWYTEHYSIETFISDSNYVDHIIQKFGGKIPPARRLIFIKQFEEELLRFVKFVRSYSAYICEVRSTGEHPKFDDFGIEKLFQLGVAGNPASRGRLAAAKAALRIDADIPLARILARSREFDMSNWKRWLRGKLALQIARKSYERAVRKSPENVRPCLPSASRISRDALPHVFSFIGNIPTLKFYCDALATGGA